MDENVETEVRRLVRRVSEKAMQGGGMDRLTYETLSEATAALMSNALAGERQGRGEALYAMRERLRACGSETHA
ncbi:hypothetical protein [Methylobacterium sp. NEAU K]|uniref:hypothetical protein n=1 Tax=Methylobacterium sp. NEAU K TaxID=3064946 RepID=UPI002735E1C8|nr:hypothetical protein [Methylobacterium sp. NEAU K]MDP4002702.1 hypothetical protein [Methylobacterium sp. NEAU K]